MKFLVDNALSPVIADALRATGYDCVHVRDYNMQSASDGAIFEKAAEEGRTLISTDTDFASLLAHRQTSAPSLVLLRRVSRIPSVQSEMLRSNLPAVQRELAEGSIVVIEESRMRVRRLPIGEDR